MTNKIALVFGGTRGIGAASVQKLAEGGYDVAYTYVTSAPNVPAMPSKLPVPVSNLPGGSLGAGRTRYARSRSSRS